MSIQNLQEIGKNTTQYVIGALITIVTFTIIMALIGALFITLFDIDPEPYIIDTARLIGLGKLIEFDQVFINTSPDSSDSTKQFQVCSVVRRDTDGDKFREWIVFYQVDLVERSGLFALAPCPGESPRRAVIYDTDRGEPPILYPYSLNLPDRDYLSSGSHKLDYHELIANEANTTNPIEEIFIFGNRYPSEVSDQFDQLSIFAYRENTQPWELPRDDPPRYQLIGHFASNGSVDYNAETKQVTVQSIIDTGDRSQLATYSIYALNQTEGTFFADATAAQTGNFDLGAPVESKIDFAYGNPFNIVETEFPEKILLTFYKSLASDNDDLPWQATDLLAEGGEALGNYNNDSLQYFGFPSDSAISDISITQLEYFPSEEQLEVPRTESDLGEIRRSRVDIAVSAKQDGRDVSTSGIISFEMVLLKGEWKINKRL